jgi:hypothetical protein
MQNEESSSLGSKKWAGLEKERGRETYRGEGRAGEKEKRKHYLETRFQTLVQL